MISKRPIEFLFDEASFALDCRGLWLEFGVFDGTTLRLAADWRSKHCGGSSPSPPVFGFDTFEGLPETWDQGAGGDSWKKGSFDLEGRLPPVPGNARLVKGLFADTLPQFLAEVRGLARHYPSSPSSASSLEGDPRSTRGEKERGEREAKEKGASRRRRGGGGEETGSADSKGLTSSSSPSSSSPPPPPPPSDLDTHVNPSGVGAAGGGFGAGALSSLHVSYLHVDCDLYAGARDALSLLSPLLRPGAVLVFDDLVNYPAYRDHEARALWEWVASTGLHLRVIGAKGPLPAREGGEEAAAAAGREPGAAAAAAAARPGEGGAGSGGGSAGREGPSGGGDPPPPGRGPLPQSPVAVELDPRSAAPHHHQSVAFLVV